MTDLGSDVRGLEQLRLQGIRAVGEEADGADDGPIYSLPMIEALHCDVDQHCVSLATYRESTARLKRDRHCSAVPAAEHEDEEKDEEISRFLVDRPSSSQPKVGDCDSFMVISTTPPMRPAARERCTEHSPPQSSVCSLLLTTAHTPAPHHSPPLTPAHYRSLLLPTARHYSLPRTTALAAGA